jgi:DNA polymerase/3'-5' exonuclease PolX
MSYEEKFKEIEEKRQKNSKERLEKERMQELAGINKKISPKIQEFKEKAAETLIKMQNILKNRNEYIK